MIKISVIVPVYNVEKFLCRCLDSVINQSLKEIEIICINDGSTDSSPDILNSYAPKDPRIKIINKENDGLSCARNDGIKIAKGEYISFIDSDDWIAADFLEKLYNTAKKHDADIAVCGIKRVKKNKESQMLLIEDEEVAEKLQDKVYLCDIPSHCYVWNKIYRTSELLKHNLFFEPHRFYEDRCFTIEVLINLKKVVSVPDVYYYYYKNKNSIVQRKIERFEADSDYTYAKLLEIMDKHNLKMSERIKKYKILGLTIFKIQTFKKFKKLIIFNCIKINLPIK